MKDNIYIIRNKASERFGFVFSSPTDATAIIDFKRRVDEHLPEWELYKIGSFDISTGANETYSPQHMDISN